MGRGLHRFCPNRPKQAPEPGPAPELNIGTSTEVKLANGMTLIVVENHKTPSVYWSMTLEFQPFQEGDKAGMMDVASAMMSSGTESRTKAESPRRLNSSGRRSTPPPQDFLRAPCPSTPTPCSRLWQTPS